MTVTDLKITGVKKRGSRSTFTDGPCPDLSPLKERWLQRQWCTLVPISRRYAAAVKALRFLGTHTNRSYWELVTTGLDLHTALEWARDCSRQHTWGFQKSDWGEYFIDFFSF